LFELLKRRGFFHLHAAGVSWGGKAAILVGASRSGKSTLSLALAREGWDFLGDDTLFLRRGEAGLECVGFPDEVDLSPRTAAFFPELQAALSRPLFQEWSKRPLRIEELYGKVPLASAMPRMVIFPRVGLEDRSRIEPLASEECRKRLLPHVLLTEKQSTQSHLEVLLQLAADFPSYSQETGRDFNALSERLKALL
jgi:hypothetical protein